MHFERALPDGYIAAYSINAKSKKIGLIFNLIAIMIMAVTLISALLPFITGNKEYVFNATDALIAYPVFLLSMLAYIVLHELLHGLGYKITTHERLTFGISWSCAFCGVPKIYVYRKTAMIALILPLLTFTLILLPLSVLLFFYASSVVYTLSVLLFAIHLGGCVGDIYVLLLLSFKYRSKFTLINDTGPMQTIYIPENGAE